MLLRSKYQYFDYTPKGEGNVRSLLGLKGLWVQVTRQLGKPQAPLKIPALGRANPGKSKSTQHECLPGDGQSQPFSQPTWSPGGEAGVTAP